uniref:GPI inositol-deacylase n=1 Tax=Erythrolobus madagascarensis TaxID=708628 RepID=A0A7S0T5C5_9RHOD
MGLIRNAVRKGVHARLEKGVNVAASETGRVFRTGAVQVTIALSTDSIQNTKCTTVVTVSTEDQRLSDILPREEQNWLVNADGGSAYVTLNFELAAFCTFPISPIQLHFASLTTATSVLESRAPSSATHTITIHAPTQSSSSSPQSFEFSLQPAPTLAPQRYSCVLTLLHAPSVPQQHEQQQSVPLDFNATGDFLRLFERAKSHASTCGATARETFSAQFPNARDLTFVLIPGLFTNHYPSYFARTKQWLTALGLSVTTVPLNTEQSVAVNSTAILDFIQSLTSSNQHQNHNNTSSRRFVFIAHSKGCCDLLDALLRSAELRRVHLMAAVCFQGPFYGTAVADWVDEHASLRSVAGTFTKLFSGSADAYRDLSFARCGERMEKYGECMDDLRERIVCVGSSSSFEMKTVGGSVDGVLGIVSMGMSSKAIMQHTGFESDGLVCPHDARLPGAASVRLDGMMHSHPALFVKGTAFDAGALAHAALELALGRALGYGLP